MFNNIEVHFGKWATKMYGKNGLVINRGVEKESLLADFVRKYPQYRPILTMRGFRKLLLLHCKQHGLTMNPHTVGLNDWRDKSNGKEFYFICDDRFDAARLDRLVIQSPIKSKKQ